MGDLVGKPIQPDRLYAALNRAAAPPDHMAGSADTARAQAPLA